MNRTLYRDIVEMADEALAALGKYEASEVRVGATDASRSFFDAVNKLLQVVLTRDGLKRPLEDDLPAKEQFGFLAAARLLEMRMLSAGVNDPQRGALQKIRSISLGLTDANGQSDMNAISQFAADPSLETLILSIRRDIEHGAHPATLDRLHSYCMKKFRYLLDARNIQWGDKEPIHGIAGRYLNDLRLRLSLHDTSTEIIKSFGKILEKFNHLRNNHTLAHDNNLIDKAEARLIFDSICAILIFIDAVETT